MQEKKALSVIDGQTLMAQPFEPLRFTVENILPHGLFMMAGSPKIGKSWLSLDLCLAVASGGKLWAFGTEQGDALYLALEDTYHRLQNRLKQMEAQDVSRLHLATASLGLQDGLLEQISSFISENPGTNLIVIDTFEHIRNCDQDKSLYASDYRDMTLLREITNHHKLTLLLIHHTRKMHDPDPLNTISGSTGLAGSVDGVLVLEKIKRNEGDAKLTICNRDTEGFCFDLRFDPEKCRWAFMCHHVGGGDDETDGVICDVIDDFLRDEWSGTATDLCVELSKLDATLNLTPVTLTKRLKSLSGLFRKDYGIAVDFARTHGGKHILLKRQNH